MGLVQVHAGEEPVEVSNSGNGGLARVFDVIQVHARQAARIFGCLMLLLLEGNHLDTIMSLRGTQ